MNLHGKVKIPVRMFKTYVKYRMGERSPFFCSFFTTFRCNLECTYCPIGSRTRSEVSRYANNLEEEMDTTHAKRAIDWLGRLGISALSFTGGEPLLRDDITELGLHAKKIPIFTILNTNGILITEENVHEVGDSFDSITVSLAGNEDTDNKLRGERVSERVTGAIKLLKKETDINININFVINRKNSGEIEKIAARAKELRVNSITFLPVSHEFDYLLDRRKAKSVKNRLLELKREYGDYITNNLQNLKNFDVFLTRRKFDFNCDAFNLYLSLSPDGTLHGCCSYPDNAGNIFEKTPREFRRESGLKRKRLLDKCDGCSSALYRELTYIFNRPAIENILHLNKYLKML